MTALAAGRAEISVASNIEVVQLSPKGERALFSARGDIFTRSDRKRSDSQPDSFIRRARQMASLVA